MNKNINEFQDKTSRNELIREKLGIENNTKSPLLYFSIPFELENEFYNNLWLDNNALIISLASNKIWALDLTQISIDEAIDLLQLILKESYSRNNSKIVLMDSTKITYVPPVQDNYQEPIHEFWVYQGNYKYMLPEIKASIESKEAIKNIVKDTKQKLSTIW
jgi:hypothetical protein